MRVKLVSTVTGLPLLEVPVARASFTDTVNGAGDASVSFALSGLDSVAYTDPWRMQVALTDDDGKPVWIGPIVGRKGSASSTLVELSARQWECWLERVWLPDTYDDDGRADAATVVAGRVSDAMAFAADRPGRLAAPIRSMPPPLIDTPVDYAWKSSWSPPDVWRGTPPSVMDDITTITDQGIAFSLAPHIVSRSWGVRVEVRAPSTAPEATVQVGYDISDIDISTETDTQATDVWVVGDGFVGSSSPRDVEGQPLLMAAHSAPQVNTQAAVDAIAGALATASARPLLGARDITVRGMVQVRAGDLVEIDVPSQTFRQWPLGVRWLMRASQVRWETGAGGDTTTLTLVQPVTDVAPWQYREQSLVALVRDLRRRLSRAEARRPGP